MKNVRVIRKRIKPPLKAEGLALVHQLGILGIFILGAVGLVFNIGELPALTYGTYLIIRLTCFLLGLICIGGMALAMYEDVYEGEYRALPRHYLYYPWGFFLILCGAGILNPIFYP